ncbi:MAG: hypothetical protein B7Y62_09980 [Sphingomonadales bacterium 35-56-22]|jgi:hypothetical protein|uniref:hypothetical protein n=1 Tax=Sphingorhabdus sp. TaxID=1902408 RepID=UPI000BD477F0|nr:hypothetical protein [Sphingorhabdus sp.]OYY14656.1 MAG: hypothetical protein B7Y62_09980 [Sphingomonadales bacterium 35-56-22]OYY98441.1 MAG: hypothetical protein B7Y38_04365 [Sphingomonadales bacterium 28-56-43]OYZ59701.1 MAG: hypothetical protein B7Y10_10020 [Sphingomonadales bacterium 24-56-14]OZA82053.1 MAG: hypothetical protein B7X66_10370 [Sphingomonadales bacterium 39-57-19]HQS12121.1 hypothetical protein [Sphingorhabdus sp.]
MTTNQLLLEAIALKKCVTATYNNVAMKLAPHVLYSKNNALFIDAIALEKHGEPPREKKLGAFHLLGLNDLKLTEQPFAVDPLFEAGAEKYAGVTLFMISGEHSDAG